MMGLESSAPLPSLRPRFFFLRRFEMDLDHSTVSSEVGVLCEDSSEGFLRVFLRPSQLSSTGIPILKVTGHITWTHAPPQTFLSEALCANTSAQRRGDSRGCTLPYTHLVFFNTASRYYSQCA